jgi:DNA-binding NarL/FixJ family response regulator
MIKIILADDHTIVRQGIRSLLDTHADFEVVGEASDGREAIQLTRELKPDVLVVDVMMPGLNGLEVARQVSGETHVLMLSMHRDEVYVLEALHNGAAGYLLKDTSDKELLQAIRTVATGQRYLSPPFSEYAISSYVEKFDRVGFDLFELLTDREREIFFMVVDGRNSTTIAEELSISPRTVETHRANMMSKLGMNSQTELVKYAIKKGLISLDS